LTFEILQRREHSFFRWWRVRGMQVGVMEFLSNQKERVTVFISPTKMGDNRVM